MDPGTFLSAQRITQQIRNLKQYQLDREGGIKKAFPTTYSYGDQEPEFFKIDIRLEKKFIAELNEDVQTTILRLEKEFEAL